MLLHLSFSFFEYIQKFMLLSLEIYANWSRFCRINTNFLITSHCACSSGGGNLNLKDFLKQRKTLWWFYARRCLWEEKKIFHVLFLDHHLLIIRKKCVLWWLRKVKMAKNFIPASHIWECMLKPPFFLRMVISVQWGHIKKLLCDFYRTKGNEKAWNSKKLANDVVFASAFKALQSKKFAAYLRDERWTLKMTSGCSPRLIAIEKKKKINFYQQNTQKLNTTPLGCE